MGRRRTQLKLNSAQQTEFVQQLNEDHEPRVQERLKFIEHAASGKYTLEDLARKIGRSRSTIQNWQAKFAAGGMKALLERESPPGRESPVGKPEIQTQLSAGLASGRLKTATQVSNWLESKHGLKLSRKSVYYWLGKRRRRVAAKSKRARSGQG